MTYPLCNLILSYNNYRNNIVNKSTHIIICAIFISGVHLAGFTSLAADVRVVTTTSDKAKDLYETKVKFNDKDNKSIHTIRLDASASYQTIDGFGAAITGSTAYNLLRMADAEREKFLVQTFSPTEGYGMSYVRIPIGCSDFSLSEYTCCDKEGIENFSLTAEETEYIIPVMKEILRINPNVKVISAPWTAPRWMKVNNLTDLQPYYSWTSGHVNPAYYQDYAMYFVKWIQAFEDAGIKIYGMTPQNEPLNRGNSASTFMGWDEQRDFIKTALGPKMVEAGLSTKIYAFDHNYNYDNMAEQQGYPTKIYADPQAAKYLAGAAYHNYGGNKEELNSVHEAYPDKELVFTESTAGFWNDGANLPKRLVNDMDEITIGTINRWCRGAIVWNLMLDSQRGPNRPGGCTTGFGAVDIDENYKEIKRNSYYYIMAHMSIAGKPGGVRIQSSDISLPGVTYTAFRNPDNTYGIALSNRNNEDVKITVDDGTRKFDLILPAQGITSASWSAI